MEFDVLIFAILTTGAVLIVSHLTRLAKAAMLHRTIRKAISNDMEGWSALLDDMPEKPAPSRDDRTGLVLLALALATGLFGLINGDQEHARSMAAIAMFPALVGAVLLARFVWMRRKGDG
jgi:hypothetical protein